MSIIYRVAVNSPQYNFSSDEGVGFGYSLFVSRTSDVPSYFEDWATSADDTTSTKLILSVQIDEPTGRKTYTRKTNYADYTTEQGSFYFNAETQLLYINFNVALPVISGVLIGVSRGYTSADVTYINGIEYLPLLLTNTTIDKNVDSLGGRVISLESQDIELINSSGEQAVFIDQPVPGNVAYLSYIDDSDNVTDFYAGKVDTDDFTTSVYIQNLQDLRAKDNVLCPITLFTVDDYTYLDDSLVNKIIPEGYGYRKSVECFPLNTNTTGDVTYKFATDATTIHAAYYLDDDDAWQTATLASSDAANGEFTIASATVRDGDSVRDVKAEVTLRDISNPGDIIADMNSRYGGVTFDTTGYNTAEWATEKAKLADISLYMDESKNLFEWIELMQTGSDLNFIYDTIVGMRTLRVDQDDRDPIFKFDEVRLLNDGREVNRNFEEYQSKIVIWYDYSDTDENWEILEDTTYEDIAKREYGTEKVTPQETLLTTLVNAQARATRYAEDRSQVRPEYVAEIKIDSSSVFDIKLYDTGIVDFTYGDRAYFGIRRVKVIGISTDLDTERITYTLRETVDQTISTGALYILDSNGENILDSNGDYIYSSGTLWEVT